MLELIKENDLHNIRVGIMYQFFTDPFCAFKKSFDDIILTILHMSISELFILCSFNYCI